MVCPWLACRVSDCTFLLSGAFHTWKVPRLCNLDDDISAESDFDLEDVWNDVDGDGDLMSM